TELGVNRIGRASVINLMYVEPATNMVVRGFQYGPIFPTQFQYTLTALPANVTFSITETPTWLKLNQATGTTPATVTFTVDPAASSFAPGSYVQPYDVIFSNTSNVAGSQGRWPNLIVLPRTDSHDVDGDGHSDILWRDTGGNTVVWLMNGAAVASSA